MSEAELPEGWARAELSSIVDNFDGRRVPLKLEDRNSRSGPYPYYGASGIIDDIDAYLFDGEYLLIAEDGANLLSRSTPVAFEAKGKFWVNNHAHVVAPRHGIPTPFVRHYINSIDLAPFVTGSAQPKLTQKALNGIEVPLPPLNEQRRIVAKLEDLLARSKRAKQAIDAIPPLLEKLRQSILAAAFRGDLTASFRAQNPDVEPASELLERIRLERRKKWEEAELAKLKAKGKPPSDDRWKAKYQEPEPVDASELPELPEGWCWASVGELAWSSGYGTSQKCAYDGPGPVVLRIPNVVDGAVSYTDIKRTLSPSALVPEEMLGIGDLVIVRTNGSRDLVGRAALVDAAPLEPTSFASYLIRFRLVPRIATWVGTIWGAPHLRSLVHASAASSAGQHNISLSTLGTLPIPVPPEAEQSEAQRLLRQLFANRNALARLASDLTSTTGKLDPSLLAKAFRGELVPQDPNDEPASVMLERLAQERAHAEASAPKRGARKAATSKTRKSR